LCAGALESSSDLIDRRSCSVDVVDQDYCSGDGSADFKSACQIPFSLTAAQTCLARSVLAAAEQAPLHGTAQPGGDQLCLIEATLTFAPAMEGHRDDDASGERFMVEAALQNVAERSGEGNTLGVLEVVDDFSERVREEEGGSRKVENVFAFPASSTQALNGRRRFSALRAKRRRERFQARPALGTRRPPPAFQNLRTAYHAGDGKKKIENRIDQARWGKSEGTVSIAGKEGGKGKSNRRGKGIPLLLARECCKTWSKNGNKPQEAQKAQEFCASCAFCG